MLQLGFIGAGRVSAMYASALARTADVAVNAVADPRIAAAEALAAQFGARSYTDFADMLDAEDLDGVLVLVPHSLHAPIAVACVERGLHVFMDKPLATTAADGAAVRAAASRSSSTVMVCFNLLFHPGVVAARRLLATGRLGMVRAAECWSEGWLDLQPWDFRLSRDATGGGAWVDNGPHMLYTLEALVGPISRVRVSPVTSASRLEGEDTALALVEFATGAAASVRISYSSVTPKFGQPWPAGWRMGFRVFGEHGTLELDLLPTFRMTVTGSDAPIGELPADVDFAQSFAGALGEFLAALREQRSPSVTVDDALANLRHTLHDYAPE